MNAQLKTQITKLRVMAQMGNFYVDSVKLDHGEFANFG